MREEEKAGGVGSSYFSLSLFGLELPPNRDKVSILRANEVAEYKKRHFC